MQREGLGDFDELLVADAEAAGGLPRVDLAFELFEEAGGGLFHRAVVAEAEPAADLAAEEDVGGGGELFDEVELLMDDADAGGFGVARARKRTGLPARCSSPVVIGDYAGEDFHQGAFAGAVFAADGVELARRHVEGHVGEGGDAGEAFGEADGDDGEACGRRHSETGGQIDQSDRGKRRGRGGRSPPGFEEFEGGEQYQGEEADGEAEDSVRPLRRSTLALAIMARRPAVRARVGMARAPGGRGRIRGRIGAAGGTV